MVLTKKDFADLTVFELLQNIWEYMDDLENIIQFVKISSGSKTI